jgi:hypothetical protein
LLISITDSEDKKTKAMGDWRMFTTHVVAAPPSKETGAKGNKYDKGKEHDKEGSDGYMGDHKSTKTMHNITSGSSEKSFRNSTASSFSKCTSTVSIGPEETMLMESDHVHMSSTVMESAGVFNVMSTTSETPPPMMTMDCHYGGSCDSSMVTEITVMTIGMDTGMETPTMETVISTTMMETAASTTAMETGMSAMAVESAMPTILMDTSSAPGTAYTMPPYPQSYVAPAGTDVPSTMTTLQSTTVAFATGGYLPNATTSIPAKFTGGSERLNTNSLMVMALFALAFVLM